jgi:catechol 2,3-dioxygenase-like lactoylglutathione lyase family enzyme
MRSVPVFYSSDLARSLAFYTQVLEFELRYPEYRELALHNGVVDLVCNGAVVQLSIHMGHNPSASSANLELDRRRSRCGLPSVDCAWPRSVPSRRLTGTSCPARSNLGNARILCQ